jgi:hypothetical protein
VEWFSVLDIKQRDGIVSASLIGTPFSDLTSYLIAEPALRSLGLDDSVKVRKKKEKRLAPKEHGFNIEGLSETRDGQTLLIGLRNPRPQGKALLVPLLNPDAMLTSHDAPSFGLPVLLDFSVAYNGKKVPRYGVRSPGSLSTQDLLNLATAPVDQHYQIASASTDILAWTVVDSPSPTARAIFLGDHY